MKKIFIRISSSVVVAAAIIVVLANNKAKIDAAAQPVKDKTVVPIKVHEVKIDSFSTGFSVNGTTFPEKEVKIASEVQGKLVNLYIENGDVVKAGQVIAVLDASVFTAQLNSIQTSLSKTQLDISRLSKLIKMGGATETQLEDAVLQHESLLAQKKEVLQQMSHMQIRAPFSGRIENVLVEKGSYVTHGTVLSDLLDISSLKIKVYLSEKETFRSKTGETVSLNNPVLAKAVKGVISSISDKADASGKFLAEISFNNRGDGHLKAGMLVDVSFAGDVKEKGLSVPVSALTGGSKQAKVYVIKNNHAELHSIRTRISTADKVQVTEGLNAGDKVVVSGQLNLENGSAISINQ